MRENDDYTPLVEIWYSGAEKDFLIRGNMSDSDAPAVMKAIAHCLKSMGTEILRVAEEIKTDEKDYPEKLPKEDVKVLLLYRVFGDFKDQISAAFSPLKNKEFLQGLAEMALMSSGDFFELPCCEKELCGDSGYFRGFSEEHPSIRAGLGLYSHKRWLHISSLKKSLEEEEKRINTIICPEYFKTISAADIIY